MKVRRLIPVLTLAFSGVPISAGIASASPAPFNNWLPGSTYDCNGSGTGIVPPGNYGSMVITGVCYMTYGTVNIRGNLIVAPGALLDAAATAGDPIASPVLPATVVVGGNVSVGSGAALLLGASPATGDKGVTYDRIGGNLTASGSLGVVVHSVAIGGSVSILGGGTGTVGGNECGVDPAPWSEDASLTGIPVYTDFEDNSIGGSITYANLATCWIGSFRNQVGGSGTYAGNTSGDPDSMEIGSNVFQGNLSCFANSLPNISPPPVMVSGVQFGDSGAAPNIVGGFASGECGFNVVLPNPAPEAIIQRDSAGPSISEHISVPMSSLRTYIGTHTELKNVASIDLGDTASGDDLSVALNNASLSGPGLDGLITAVYPPTSTAPLGSTGEVVLSTTSLVDGSDSFLALDNCTCSLGAVSGAVTIEAYGTTSASGVTSGTFLIITGGGGYGLGGLDTLAGYGTFNNWGEPTGTLRVIEHLAITPTS